MRTVLLVAALALASGACASAPIRAQDQVLLDRAAGWISEGCYDCLLEARDVYQRLAVGRARPLVLPRLVETEALIAIRERELALDPTAAEERALSLASEVAPGLDVARLVSLVRQVAPEPYGTPRITQRDRRLELSRAGQLSALPAEYEWLQSSTVGEPLRGYLAIALHCQQNQRLAWPAGLPSRPSLLDWPATSTALMAYRAASCRTPDVPALERLRSDAPRFIEVAYFLARPTVASVQRSGNVADARTLVDAAYARFADSPAVTYLNGSFNQLIGDCKAALRFYDETIALRPLHEDALLGRTVCLTFLRESAAAIDAATHMVTLRTDNRVDALYWRAWNHWSRKKLVEARADIEAAKALRSNAEIHTLAGQIEHDQNELVPAEFDLRTAIDMSYGMNNCVADWYLGLVLMKKQEWPGTAQSFENAMRCYEVRVRESEAGLADVQTRADLDPDYRARQVAGFEAALKEDRGQYHAAAFNAANHFARAGDPGKARTLVEIAAADPALADLVRQLRAILK